MDRGRLKSLIARRCSFMKKPILFFSVCFVLFAGLVTGCHRQPDAGKAALGPMPTEAILPDPLARQTAGEMRSWVQSLKPSDAQILNGTGKIVFSWQELQAAYPEPARVIDDYQEQRRVGIVEAFQKQSKPIPERLAAHHAPDTVEVWKSSSGECGIVLSSKTGIEHGYLQISTAR
jgi:hypothetical protein